MTDLAIIGGLILAYAAGALTVLAWGLVMARRAGQSKPQRPDVRDWKRW